MPNATGISPIPADRSPDKFWEIRAFDVANPELHYRYGNAGRNLLTTPGVMQWDFSLTKTTRINERHAVEFRFEASNLANHPNFNAPPVDPRQPATFGRITTARTMRELQFGVKYQF
ncbi:MAG: hypothetical protein FJW31_24430 [Acidobacteria bacterium]|nr:hypothetical protein [Acidobacteriota bacterium]